MNKKVSLVVGVMAMFILLLQISSCKKADIKFGEQFIDNDGTQIFKVDSFSANLSTVYQDSFITSASGEIMLGAYTDAYFGRITTNSYFEVVPPVWADLYQNTFFDSLTLILKTNGNYYGDSTKPVTIYINQLQDSIYLPENKYAFYNTSKFAAKPTSLGSFTGIITPKSNQTISVTLPRTLGVTILNKLKDINDNTTHTAAQFLSFFKGIQITTNASSEMIANCSDNVVMRLAYRQNSFNTLYKTLDFTLANKSHQFNNISIVRTGDLATQGFGATNREISSTVTSNAAYTQSATGSLVKISFPSLKELPKIKNFAKVLKAVLIIKPIKGSYNSTYFLPPTLRLSTTNSNNLIGNDLAYVSNNGALAVQLGLLQTDYFTGNNTQYQYDLTEYVKSVLNNTTTNNVGDGLLLSPPFPSFESNFSRVIIGNGANSLGNIQLQIYYATIK